VATNKGGLATTAIQLLPGKTIIRQLIQPLKDFTQAFPGHFDCNRPGFFCILYMKNIMLISEAHLNFSGAILK